MELSHHFRRHLVVDLLKKKARLSILLCYQHIWSLPPVVCSHLVLDDLQLKLSAKANVWARAPLLCMTHSFISMFNIVTAISLLTLELDFRNMTETESRAFSRCLKGPVVPAGLNSFGSKSYKIHYILCLHFLTVCCTTQ